jgi:hypothetical protein
MSELGRLVAVRSLDKVVIKGVTFDFRPSREFFHLADEDAAAPVRVAIENLKAIFFIKTPGRDPSCVDKKSFGERAGPEKKVWIEFVDGEKMAGWSSSFGSPREGFFVFPADPNSNTEMAYVFRAAIDQMEEGERAEQAAREFNSSRREPPTSVPEPDPSNDEPPPSAWELKSAEDFAVGSYRMVRKRSKRPSRDTG